MQVDAVIERVNQILVEEFELEPDAVVPSANLRDDLQLDSLDGMDLIVALEKEFAFRVDEKELLKLSTVGDVHAFIRRTVEAAQGAQV